MIAIGFLLGAVLPSVRTTQAVAAAIYFPAIFVSGALFPREVLPAFAQRIGDFLPMTYAVRVDPGGLDRAAPSTGSALGILAGTTVAGVAAIAVRMFRWEPRSTA